MALPLLTDSKVTVDVNHDSTSLKGIDLSLKQVVSELPKLFSKEIEKQTEELKDHDTNINKKKVEETVETMNKFADVLKENIGLFRKSDSYQAMQRSRLEGNQVIGSTGQQPAVVPQRNTYAVQNLSLGRIAGDTMREGRDRLLNRFRENSFIKFGSRLADGINAFRGQPTNYSQNREQTQSELESEQKDNRNQKKIINLLEYLPKILLKLDGDKDEKKEEKGLLRKLLDAFLIFKAGNWLASLIGGGLGAAGIGALMAKAGTLLGAGLGIGAAIAKLGLAAVIGAAILGTVFDSFMTYFKNSDDWKAGPIAKIFGSILGGSGGVYSAALRGITGAYLGFKAGALFGPMGAIIGLILGGVIGAITGYIGGEKIAETMSEIGDDFAEGWKKLMAILTGKTIDDVREKTLRVIDETSDPTSKTELTNSLENVENSNDRLQAAETKRNELFEKVKEQRNINAQGSTPDSREKLRELEQQYNEAIKEYDEARKNFREDSRNLSADVNTQDSVNQLDKVIYGKEGETVEIQKDGLLYGKDNIEVTVTPQEQRIAANQKRNVLSENRLRRLQQDLVQDASTSPLLEESTRKEYQTAQETIEEKGSLLNKIPLFGSFFDDEEMAKAKATVERIEAELLQKKKDTRLRMNQIEADMAATVQENIGLGTQDRSESMTNIISGETLGGPDAQPEPRQRINSKANERSISVDPAKSKDGGRQDQTSIQEIKPDAVVANLSDEQVKTYALELIRREEMGSKSAALTPIQDPAKYWKDDGSKMMQLGYGSNFIKEGNEWVKVKPGYENSNGEMVYPHQLKSEAEAEQLLRDSFNREFDQFMKDPEKKAIFDQIQNPARKMVLMSTIYQLGEHGMDKFKKTWPLIKSAVEEQDWNLKGYRWQTAAREMANSVWHNEQTPERAGRVVDVIANGGDVRWDGGVIYQQSAVPSVAARQGGKEAVKAKAGAEGRVVTQLEEIVVGDYKGIENNPEVVIPMNDLEERVLQTVTKMMEIRDQTASRNNELLSMNNELRMQKFIESTQKIEQRIQAKESIENSRNQVVMPPVISQVDNSQLNQTNQSIIINRPVENAHNPFRLSLG